MKTTTKMRELLAGEMVIIAPGVSDGLGGPNR